MFTAIIGRMPFAKRPRLGQPPLRNNWPEAIKHVWTRESFIKIVLDPKSRKFITCRNSHVKQWRKLTEIEVLTVFGLAGAGWRLLLLAMGQLLCRENIYVQTR